MCSMCNITSGLCYCQDQFKSPLIPQNQPFGFYRHWRNGEVIGYSERALRKRAGHQKIAPEAPTVGVISTPKTLHIRVCKNLSLMKICRSFTYYSLNTFRTQALYQVMILKKKSRFRE